MDSRLIVFNVFFPTASRCLVGKEQLVDCIMTAMRKKGSIEYAGYLSDKELRRDLLNRIGNGGIQKYRVLDSENRKQIREIVNSVVENCYRRLPLRNLPLHIFIFPWLPDEDEAVLFESINAAAPYVSTIHLFIETKSFTKASLEQTVAHEFNHLAFYDYHGKQQNYTLLERFVIEGLAEVFREEVFGGKPAPWSTALSQADAVCAYNSLQPVFSSKNSQLYHDVFFGSDRYKRWTGYSIGYWLVSAFRAQNPQLAWKEIMQMEPADIAAVWKKKAR